MREEIRLLREKQKLLSTSVIIATLGVAISAAVAQDSNGLDCDGYLVNCSGGPICFDASEYYYTLSGYSDEELCHIFGPEPSPEPSAIPQPYWEEEVRIMHWYKPWMSPYRRFLFSLEYLPEDFFDQEGSAEENDGADGDPGE